MKYQADTVLQEQTVLPLEVSSQGMFVMNIIQTYTDLDIYDCFF